MAFHLILSAPFFLLHSQPRNRFNAEEGEEDVTAELSRWREAVSSLEREAREAAESTTASTKAIADDETSTSSFDLDSLSARLSELEQRASVLATKVGRSREGENMLASAAAAREALRAARASAAPAFSLAAVAVAGGGEEKQEEEQEQQQQQQQEQQKKEEQLEAEATASRVADAARHAARLSGLRGETLRLSAASFGRRSTLSTLSISSPSTSSPSSSSSSTSSSLSSLPSLRLEDLEDCTVVVECSLGALLATGLRRCVVFLAAPVGGGGSGEKKKKSGGGENENDRSGEKEEENGEKSLGGGGAVLIDGASASTFYLPAHQCRLHRLTDGCRVFVRSAAPPVIEACSGLRLGPYPASPSSSTFSSSSDFSTSSASSSSSSPVLPASEASLVASGLGSEGARRSWSRPKDFSWPLAAAGKPSPHWRKMSAAERGGGGGAAQGEASASAAAVGLPTAEGVEAVPVERLFPL